MLIEQIKTYKAIDVYSIMLRLRDYIAYMRRLIHNSKYVVLNNKNSSLKWSLAYWGA